MRVDDIQAIFSLVFDVNFNKRDIVLVKLDIKTRRFSHFAKTQNNWPRETGLFLIRNDQLSID